MRDVIEAANNLKKKNCEKENPEVDCCVNGSLKMTRLYMGFPVDNALGMRRATAGEGCRRRVGGAREKYQHHHLKPRFGAIVQPSEEK